MPKFKDDDPIIVRVSGWGGRDEGVVLRTSWEESTIEWIGYGADAESETEAVALRMQGHFGYPRLVQRGKTSWHLTEPGELDVWVRAELDYDALNNRA